MRSALFAASLAIVFALPLAGVYAHNQVNGVSAAQLAVANPAGAVMMYAGEAAARAGGSAARQGGQNAA